MYTNVHIKMQNILYLLKIQWDKQCIWCQKSLHIFD